MGALDRLFHFFPRLTVLGGWLPHNGLVRTGVVPSLATEYLIQDQLPQILAMSQKRAAEIPREHMHQKQDCESKLTEEADEKFADGSHDRLICIGRYEGTL
jgi:hypothetical protein